MIDPLRFRIPLRWAGFLASLLLAASIVLFFVNGLFLAERETPIQPAGPKPPPAPSARADSLGEVRVLAYNIGRLSVHEGGLRFAPSPETQNRLDRIAEIIKVHRPDLVFLNEAVWEYGHGGIDQVRHLARAADMPFWISGENYNFGLPFFRMVGGNAILSKWPLEPLGNPDLAGRKPFWIVRNNRRILWSAARIAGRRVALGAVHTDAVRPLNNLAQTWQILGTAGDRPTILAGDFNGVPGDPSILAVRQTGRFSGVTDGPATFPAGRPERTVDFIFGPAEWTVTEHRVIPSTASDHFPVFTVFRLGRAE